MPPGDAIVTIRETDTSDDEKRGLVTTIIEADKEKKRTGKSPERIMHEANIPFSGCFGLTPAMKALCDITGSSEAMYTVDSFDMDSIFLEMAELELQERRGERGLSPELVQYIVLKQTLESHFPDIDVPPIEYLRSYRPDQVLNIGDPYMRLAKLLGRRITTLDYEYGVDVQTEIIDNRMAATYESGDIPDQQTVERLCANPFTPESLKPILREMGPNFAKLNEALDSYSRGGGTTEQTIASMEVSISNIRNLSATAALNHPELDRASPMRDNRLTEDMAYTMDPIQFNYLDDYARLMRGAFYAGQAVNNLEVFRTYEDAALPQTLYENLEDLMEGIFGENGEIPPSLRYYFDKTLRSMGFDEDTWSPTQMNARPFDVLCNLFSMNGLAILDGLPGGDEMRPALETRKNEIMAEHNPLPTHVGGAPIHRMLFPYTQELPAGAFDRILASWSISPRELPSMTNEQLVDVIWKELDRLLSADGIAVIFPIGFYINDRYADAQGITAEERMTLTITQYSSKYGSNLVGHIVDSFDPNVDGGVTLVVSREGARDIFMQPR